MGRFYNLLNFAVQVLGVVALWTLPFTRAFQETNNPILTPLVFGAAGMYFILTLEYPITKNRKVYK